MMFDEQLLNDLKPNQRIIRIYKWQHPANVMNVCPEMASIDCKTVNRWWDCISLAWGLCFHYLLGKRSIYTGSLTNKLSIIANQVKQYY